MPGGAWHLDGHDGHQPDQGFSEDIVACLLHKSKYRIIIVQHLIAPFVLASYWMAMMVTNLTKGFVGIIAACVYSKSVFKLLPQANFFLALRFQFLANA